MNSIRHRLLLWLLPGLGLLWGAAGTAIYFSVRNGLETKLDADLRASVGAVRSSLRSRIFGGPPDPNHSAKFDSPDGEEYCQVLNDEKRVIWKSASLQDNQLPRPAAYTREGDYANHTLIDGRRVRVLMIREPGRGGRGGGRRGGRPGGSSGGGPPWERFLFDGGERSGGRQPQPESTFTGPDNRGVGPLAVRVAPDMRNEREGERRGPDFINIAIARSRGEIDRTLGLLLGGITFSGLGAALASMLLIRFALKSGLQPLETVGEQVTRIDASSLDHRFDLSGMPAELAPIAQRLNDLMQRMEESFERERRFSADLAHELRTPVAELKSMAEVAIKWPEQATAENYDDVRDISDRMQATIENLMMLARLENSKARITKENLVTREIFEACSKPFLKGAEERKLNFQNKIGSSEKISSDAKLLRIVFENLISNAVDYAPEGSFITVTGACEKNSRQVFAIENPAADLSPEDASHLFERLWRKDASRTDDRHCGLGLSLAQSCASQLGLELTAIKDGDVLRFTLSSTDPISNTSDSSTT